MGKVIELREHKVREYLRRRVGRAKLDRLLRFFGSESVCDSFIYSIRSDLVYVEPSLLKSFIDSHDQLLTAALDLVLDGLQRAPGEIKGLLTSDAEHSMQMQ
jgi:hypothetical protein